MIKHKFEDSEEKEFDRDCNVFVLISIVLFYLFTVVKEGLIFMYKKLRKRLLCFSLAVVMMVSCAGIAVAAPSVEDHIAVTGFDKKVDYTAKILDCLGDGGEYAMLAGSVYEKQRNLKIETLGLDYELTHYFEQYSSAEDILNAMYPPVVEEPEEEAATYSDEDLLWLSRVVFAEAGCDWFPDWVQRDVASVVLNRVADPRYPDTIKDVIFDPGQYSCAASGSIYNNPTQKVIDNCRYVLENGSTLPGSVIGQSAYALGPIYKSYYDSVLGTTIHFFSC